MPRLVTVSMWELTDQDRRRLVRVDATGPECPPHSGVSESGYEPIVRREIKNATGRIWSSDDQFAACTGKPAAPQVCNLVRDFSSPALCGARVTSALVTVGPTSRKA
jgi:hypothetical protein